jgi:SH3-like domain-containing protein
MRILNIVLALLLILYAAVPVALAKDAGKKDSSVPRFVTLATDEVNMRTGPGMRYPIRLVIRKEGLPVEVIREFDIWRQVRDVQGDEGWVHQSMLSGRRAVVLKKQVQSLLEKPEAEARPVARLEPGVVASLKTCDEGWCQISVAQFEGWISRQALWGVYPQEKFDE